AFSSGFEENQPPNRLPPSDFEAEASAIAIAGGVTSPEAATIGAELSSGMRGGRTVGGMVPGAVVTRKDGSCGATPIWFFFTASTNTGCMPPSAPVLTGAV